MDNLIQQTFTNILDPTRAKLSWEGNNSVGRCPEFTMVTPLRSAAPLKGVKSS
jgi:hypothetical protein